MSTALLLTLYVTVDTTRALLVFGALHSRSASGGVELSPSLLTFAAEAFKLFLIAIPGVLITTPREVGRSRFLLNKKNVGSSNSSSRWETLRPYTKFAIPAALYGTNNVLYFTGLKITSPALLQVCVLSKVNPLLSSLSYFRADPPFGYSLVTFDSFTTSPSYQKTLFETNVVFFNDFIIRFNLGRFSSSFMEP